VTLVERDPVELGAATDSVDWPRRGIRHFLSAHSFTSRGRLELVRGFPDVHRELLDAGADDIDLVTKLPGERRPEDADLRMIGVRRPLIEWALRKAVLSEPRISVRGSVTVIGLEGAPGNVPRVTGVRTTEGSIEADLVIDSMGRRSPTPGWIKGLGGTPMAEESSDCGVIYYTRYYRVRPGCRLPDGPWLPTPRADLGYGLFSTFPGDNGTFAPVLQTAPEDTDLKALRRAPAFEAAVTTLPALHAWVSRAEPITDILPFGMVQNAFRHYADENPGAAQNTEDADGGRPRARGFVPVGDALCHTNPMFALGLSQALIHAFALADALAGYADLGDAAAAYHAAVEPEAAERFALARACDDARWRLWRGEPVDFVHRAGGAYELFVLAAGGAASFADADVFRAVARRTGFLDRTAVLNEDVALQARIEALFGQARAQPRPAPGPPRDELLRVIALS
jgi:2-polyprenyl-6-methoxyphenol hydroxylase-like FAD-dependent oxidoreductase